MEKENFEKWENSGLLYGILDEEKKIKVASSLELATQILASFKEMFISKKELELYVPPCIRKVLNETGDSFEFTEKNMLEFIEFIDECLNIKLLEKHLNKACLDKNIYPCMPLIDVETLVLSFLCEMYSANQNAIIKIIKPKLIQETPIYLENSENKRAIIISLVDCEFNRQIIEKLIKTTNLEVIIK